MYRSIAFLVVLMFFAASFNLYAACQYGSDWSTGSKKIVVCVKGDSFSDRDRAEAVCSKVKGSSCGNASTFSSSCGNGECYDENGKNHHSLSGY